MLPPDTTPHRSPTTVHRPRIQRGFTLIELLVALLLLDVGLLGLVGFATALYRNGNDTRATARAWAIASARVERMASVACGGTSAGTATSAGAMEWFSEAAGPNDTRLLFDSVRVASSRGVQVATLQMSSRC
jgi:prepilin-type N-terminal cleavage/methylation domain-containing protein